MAHSKRARILRRVLDYVNAGSWWAEKNGLLIFGDKQRVDACLASAATPGVSDDAVKEVQAIRSSILARRGHRAAARRVSVGQLPPEPTTTEIEKWLLSLKPERREEVLKYIAENLSIARIDPETNAPMSREDDNLDAALALDVINQLENGFGKIKAYRVLRIQHASPWVQQYFEEAHRCYIYGMEAACAVLCRGLLEAVLSDLVDPTFTLRRKSGPVQSHLSAMIAAAQPRLFTPKMASAAELIRDSGNAAVHDLKQFRSTYAPQLGQIVESTRFILSKLYR